MKKSAKICIYTRLSLLHFLKHKGKKLDIYSYCICYSFFNFEFTPINYLF